MDNHRPLPPIRRVVTGDDVKGISRIVEDAPATSIRQVPARPGYRAVNVWRTEGTPAKITAQDSTEMHQGILPPRNGTILRIIDFPPEPHEEAELKHQIDSTFG